MDNKIFFSGGGIAAEAIFKDNCQGFYLEGTGVSFLKGH
jgi:hypothetical protein